MLITMHTVISNFVAEGWYQLWT